MVAWSQIKSVDYSCYDVGHTWTPSCTVAVTEVAFHAFKESLRIYASVYLLTTLLTRRRLTWKSFWKLLRDIFQSACFLTMNGFSFIGFMCFSRWLFGKFYIFNAGFIPGFLSSFAAILLERKARRAALAVYVMNVITDAIFRMVTFRGLVKPVQYGEILIFSLTMSGFMYLYKCRYGVHDITSKCLSFLIGPEEGGQQVNNNSFSEVANGVPCKIENKKDKKEKDLLLFILRLIPIRKIEAIYKQLQHYLASGPKHETCLHRNSCFSYCLKGFLKPFGFGFSVQLFLSLYSAILRMLNKPSLSTLRNNIKLSKCFQVGLFLGGFSSIYKFVSCLLRWIRNKDDETHGLIAGFLAGLSMFAYPAPSLTLYIMWKLIHVMYNKGYENGYLPSFYGGSEILYSIVTGIMFHLAIWEPHNLKPSYWMFLLRLTNNRFKDINRHLLDMFGKRSSFMMPVWNYQYDHQFTSPTLKEYMQFIGMTIS